MKKNIGLCLLVSLLIPLSGCSPVSKEPAAAEATPYSFENVQWGMSPQEVLDSRELGLDDAALSGVKVGAASPFTQFCIRTQEVLHGVPAEISYTFSNLYIAADPDGPSIGLTAVSVHQSASGEELDQLIAAYDGLLGGGIRSDGAGTLADAEAALAEKYRAFWQLRDLDVQESSPLEYAAGGLDGEGISLHYYGEGLALLRFLETSDDPAAP